MKTIADYCKECHAVAVKKGFWDNARNTGEIIALIHSELSEALEALRSRDETQNNVAEELADACIRIFDFCGAYNINLDKAIQKKIIINKKRPKMHGKKF